MKREWIVVFAVMMFVLGACDDSASNNGANNNPGCEGTMASCDMDPSDCETDLSTSIAHCGACGSLCDPTNATGACIDGVCTIQQCADGFFDIDGNPYSGCEYACTPQNPGEIDVCDGEDNNCNGLVDEGIDLFNDIDNCGSCGVVCEAGPNSEAVACVNGQCVISACADGFEDCDGDILNGCEADLNNDTANCGACGEACDYGPNTAATCGLGVCANAGCAPDHADCNLWEGDGCEVDLTSGQACVCTPGETRPCYDGDPSTLNVPGAPCAEGLESCSSSGTSWSGACVGQVLPIPESLAGGTCSNGIDDDCSGAIDDGVDEDGDGWTTCQGDCCDSIAQGCSDPEKVNPGAFDWVDPAGIEPPYDDDCDGIADNPAANDCSTVFDITSVTANDLASAMDLCKFTTEGSGEWGVISAQLLRADGSTPEPVNVQVGVLNSFGTNVLPRGNATTAVLSSGTARDQDGDGDDTGYVFPDGTGYEDASNEVSAPPDYLAANGGQLQTVAGCPAGDPIVNDSVQLRLRIRVPTNAQGFSFNFKFYSSEYPEWVCDSYNDFFLAMLYTSAPGIPADHNISFDAQGNPVSVNNAFFEVCSGCANGTAELVATGYPETDAGGTSWLMTSAPVIPGEIIELQFHIWDTGDHAWDSLVLIDNFTWSLDPTSVVTVEE